MEKELKDLKKFKIITIICIVLSSCLAIFCTFPMSVWAEEGYTFGAITMFVLICFAMFGYIQGCKTFEIIKDQEENIKNR